METARIKRFALVPALVLATALLFVGCVPDEGDFVSDHPRKFNEGEIGNPVDLGTTPISRASGVGPGGNSYYFALTTTGIITYTLSGLSGNADLGVYFDANFQNVSNNLLCSSTNSGTSSESCSTSCPFASCNTFIRVVDFEFGDGGTSFTLQVLVN